MIPILLVAVPFVAGVLTLLIRREEGRPIRCRILVWISLFHAVGTGSLYFLHGGEILPELVRVDSLGLFFLSIVSLLFLSVSIYSIGYFRNEREPVRKEGVRHLFVPCMLFFLAAMTLTTLAAQVGVLWIAVEVTTVSSAPLIYYHHNHQALEAAWKYLLICSVGIAIALLGIFFVVASGRGVISDLDFATIVRYAGSMDPHWLRIGFILILIGFGTKMGLAPLHNWLPDAHSEAPFPVSALLSGAVLNCAFLGILRFYQILHAAGLADFAEKLLGLFGLISLFVAAVFITGQRDYKRLLAYSSVEHMGIMAFGIGVGARFGTLLHAVNHSMAKGLLFLAAGQILLSYRTKDSSEVRGLLKTVPETGLLFLLGGLAIVGLPPFSPFISEFLILREGIAQGYWTGAFLYLLFLGVIFVSMSRIVLGMVQGEPKEFSGEKPSYWMIAPTALLGVGLLVFGVYLPAPFVSFLQDAVHLLGKPS